MTSEAHEIRCAALLYAAQGWPVIPLEVGSKEPATVHGVDDAVTDADLIERWWADGKAHNAAIAIPPGVIVVDVDPRNGGVDTLRSLVSKLGAFPATPVAETRDGGLHVWLRTRLPANQINTKGLGPGIDVKKYGNGKFGGYVVAPPSRVKAETPGGTGQYRWRQIRPVAWTPSAWAQRLYKRPMPPVRHVTDPIEAQAERFKALAHLRSAVEGERNTALSISAFRLATRGLLDADAENQLSMAASELGLTAEEITNTLASAHAGAERENQ